MCQAAADRPPRRLLPVCLGSLAVAVAVAIALRESLLPFPLSVVYWLPDPVLAVLLLAPAIGESRLLERRSRVRLGLVGLANLPLVVIAWDFLTSAG